VGSSLPRKLEILVELIILYDCESVYAIIIKNHGMGLDSCCSRTFKAMKPRRLSKHWHHLVILISFIAIVSAALVFVFLHFDLIPRAGSVERGYIDNFF